MSQPSWQAFCPVCRQPLVPHANFCSHCRAPIAPAAPVAPTPALTPPPVRAGRSWFSCCLSIVLLGSFFVLAIVAGGLYWYFRTPSKPVVPGPNPSVPVESTSARIDSTGGTISLADGIRVEFPAGALSSPRDVTLQRLKGSPWASQGKSTGVWLECTVPGPEFAKDACVRVPLPMSARPEDAPKIIAGLIDPEDNTLNVQPIRLESVSGRTEAVLTTRHFCGVYIDWDVLDKPPPATAAPLEVPIYKQGETPYCWATAMQMLARDYSPSDGTVPSILGKVGLAYVGNVGLRNRPVIGQVFSERTGIWPQRYYWGVSAFTGSDVFLTHLNHYLKQQIGVHKRPVMFCPSKLIPPYGHAYIIMGYDDQGRYIVHDPREVPEAGAVATPRGSGNFEGYQKLTPKQLLLDWGLPGTNFATIVIPADPPADHAKVTLGLRHRKIYFTTKDTTVYQYRWDYTQPDGYSFQKIGRLSFANDGPVVASIPADALRLQGEMELFNCTLADRSVTPHLEINNLSSKSGKYNYSMPAIPVTVGGNLRATVTFDIDLAALRDPAVAGKQQYYFAASVVDAGKTADKSVLLFTLDPTGPPPGPPQTRSKPQILYTTPHSIPTALMPTMGGTPKDPDPSVSRFEASRELYFQQLLIPRTSPHGDDPVYWPDLRLTYDASGKINVPGTGGRDSYSMVGTVEDYKITLTIKVPASGPYYIGSTKYAGKPAVEKTWVLDK